MIYNTVRQYFLPPDRFEPNIWAQRGALNTVKGKGKINSGHIIENNNRIYKTCSKKHMLHPVL